MDVKELAVIIRETVERYVVNQEMATIGNRIRKARNAKGWSIAVAAPKCGISVPFLCDVENGKRGIAVHRLLGVAKGLGVSIGTLCKGL